jgi:hypothetical protein
MATHYAVFEKALPGCGRKGDKTYVHVCIEVGISPGTWEQVSLAYPESGPRFVVQLTTAEYATLQDFGERYWDSCSNLPRWQQSAAQNVQTAALGSFADPESAASAFTVGTALPDTRLIVRIFDGDPAGSGEQLGSRVGDPPSGEQLDEAAVPGFVTRYLKLYNQNDVPITGAGGNLANQRTEIAGKLMDLDFGSSHVPALSAGVASFEVATSRAGTIVFPSNHSYRILGPNGEKQVTWTIFGKRLEVTN